MHFLLALTILALEFDAEPLAPEPVYVWKADVEGRRDLYRNGKHLGSWYRAVAQFVTTADEHIRYDGSKDGLLVFDPNTEMVAAFCPGDDALDEVNSVRQARGLRPFIRDHGLTLAARIAARHRAKMLIAGHLASDFACLPAGVIAAAAGCAAWQPSWGWGSCCTYESYSYAGAAWALGRDGRRYMHVFVR